MAAPPDSSGRNTPLVYLTAIASAPAPALCLTVATSAAETVRSAVTTTLAAAVSLYQAMPSTPERATAALTAASRGAPGGLAGRASAAGTAAAAGGPPPPRTRTGRPAPGARARA